MKAPSAILATLAAIALAAALSSCASAPKEIPADLSAQTLIQRAQEASDAYNYKAAVAYYQALRDRYGSDPAYLCAADYEIAFIAYKEARYAEARTGLTALIERYNAADGESLPPRYRILADKVLAKIDELEKAKK
mgnify:CR=1 FL=1